LCAYIHEIRALEQAIKLEGMTVEIIDGSVPMAKREMIRDLFQRGKIKIVIGEVDAVKAGLDFSSADTVVYFSNSLSGDARIQSEDRVVHLRKTGMTVLIVDIVVEESSDEDILDLLIDKKITQELFMRKLYAKVAQ
jgi:SNF2 family DNA or RNA helicase